MTSDTSTPAAETLQYLKQPYGELGWLINAHAVNQPERIALDDGEEQLTWGETAALVNRIAGPASSRGPAKRSGGVSFSAPRPFATRWCIWAPLPRAAVPHR
jgi:acyl-CoA synthetase (AMP-forming)/AMP-acid ligase II